MWCDNCLLLLPLRSGAMAWAFLIFLYSVIGGVLLFMFGPYFYFTYPEWQIYGGVAMAVGAVALINVIALSNRSYMWTRVCFSVWPFLIVISAIRAIVMIVELQRGEAEYQWECANNLQLWPASATAGYGGSTALPSIFCTAGFPTLYAAFIVALIVDLVFQIYMFFLTWRYKKLLENYDSMKGVGGGYYA